MLTIVSRMNTPAGASSPPRGPQSPEANTNPVTSTKQAAKATGKSDKKTARVKKNTPNKGAPATDNPKLKLPLAENCSSLHTIDRTSADNIATYLGYERKTELSVLLSSSYIIKCSMHHQIATQGGNANIYKDTIKHLKDPTNVSEHTENLTVASRLFNNADTSDESRYPKLLAAVLIFAYEELASFQGKNFPEGHHIYDSNQDAVFKYMDSGVIKRDGGLDGSGKASVTSKVTPYPPPLDESVLIRGPILDRKNETTLEKYRRLSTIFKVVYMLFNRRIWHSHQIPVDSGAVVALDKCDPWIRDLDREVAMSKDGSTRNIFKKIVARPDEPTVRFPFTLVILRRNESRYGKEFNDYYEDYYLQDDVTLGEAFDEHLLLSGEKQNLHPEMNPSLREWRDAVRFHLGLEHVDTEIQQVVVTTDKVEPIILSDGSIRKPAQRFSN